MVMRGLIGRDLARRITAYQPTPLEQYPDRGNPLSITPGIMVMIKRADHLIIVHS